MSPLADLHAERTFEQWLDEDDPTRRQRRERESAQRALRRAACPDCDENGVIVGEGPTAGLPCAHKGTWCA